MSAHEENGHPGEDPAAMVVALLVLPFAIYVAFWVIDWNTDSLLRWVLPVVFCVVVPSVLGSTVASLLRAVRR